MDLEIIGHCQYAVAPLMISLYHEQALMIEAKLFLGLGADICGVLVAPHNTAVFSRGENVFVTSVVELSG